MKAAFPVDDDAPLYPSGIKILIRTDASGKPVSFTLLDMDGNPVNLDRTYTVAMNSYMTQVYRYRHEDPGHSLYVRTADATIGYLRKTGTIRSYRGENRIIRERQ
jgi:5'-nucleotidase